MKPHIGHSEIEARAKEYTHMIEVALHQIVIYNKLITNVKLDKHMSKRLKKRLIAEYEEAIASWQEVADQLSE